MLDNQDLTKSELLESINRSFSNIEAKMATKEDLENLKVATKRDLESVRIELKTEIHDFRMEVKGFRNDTEDSFGEIIDDIADLTDTVMHQDHRIEKLENKVFPVI